MVCSTSLLIAVCALVMVASAATLSRVDDGDTLELAHVRVARAEPPKKNDLPDLGSDAAEAEKKTWKVEPEVRRQDGKTGGKVRVEHQGENHRVEAEYERNYGRSNGENWHVGGTFDW